MKHILGIIALTTLLTAGANSSSFGVSVEVGAFYNSLSPYGEWVNCDFGYAWRPMHVAHGWRPYVYGRWVWTDDYGWYWVSSEPFGWATFHYGRWTYDDYYGWIWIPDRVWGPAWVEWRYDDDYIGWAPLSPYASFDFSVGITYTSGWVAPVHYWNFIPCRYFGSNRIVDYVQPIERSRRIFGNTREGMSIREDDHRIRNRGVDVNFIERRTNGRIERADVVAGSRQGADHYVRGEGRNRIETYQPRMESTDRTVNQGRPMNQGRRNPDVNGQFRPRSTETPPAGLDARTRGRMQMPQQRVNPVQPAPDRRVQSPRDNGERAWQQQQDRLERMKQQQFQQRRTPSGPERQQMREAPRMQQREPQRQQQRQPQGHDRPVRQQESRGGRDRHGRG